MTARELTVPGDFDVAAVFEAVDAQRVARDMTWGQVSRAVNWMSPKTMERMRERASSSCNHILPLIQWVGRTPESFTVDPGGAVHELLPDPGVRGWHWWWNHRDLVSQLDAQRQSRDLTWAQVAVETGWTFNLAALRRRRYGTVIGEAMIIARWLQKSAASFMSEVPPAAWNKLYELHAEYTRGEIGAAAVQQAVHYINVRCKTSGSELSDWYETHCPAV